MSKSTDIKERFAALLRDSLRGQFGRIPSAAIVAREFNLRAHGTTPISNESARRWIRGVSLPEEDRLQVLVNWLDLNFNNALRLSNAKQCASIHENPEVPNGATHAASFRSVTQASVINAAPKGMFICRGPQLSGSCSPNGPTMTDQDTKLIMSIFSLSEQQRVAILNFISNMDHTSAANKAIAATAAAGTSATIEPSTVGAMGTVTQHH